MALTDRNSTDPVSDPARFAKNLHDDANNAPPWQALARLSALHHQAGAELHLSQLLAHTPRFCIALMLAGAAALAWGSPGESSEILNVGVVWAASLLIGIVAMTRNTIQGFARSPSRVPLKAAVFELRMLLLYMGVAWGGGAFLLLPALPALVLTAGLSVACALIFNCEKGVIAFSAPATLLTAAAALMGGPSGAGTAGIALAAGAAIAAFVTLRCARRRESLQKLALR